MDSPPTDTAIITAPACHASSFSSSLTTPNQPQAEQSRTLQQRKFDECNQLTRAHRVVWRESQMHRLQQNYGFPLNFLHTVCCGARVCVCVFWWHFDGWVKIGQVSNKDRFGLHANTSHFLCPHPLPFLIMALTTFYYQYGMIPRSCSKSSNSLSNFWLGLQSQ